MERYSTALQASTRRADLLIAKDGHVTAVVEAKGLPIPQELHRAVLEQVRHFAQLTHSRWALLADPVTVRVFSHDRVEQPVATIPSAQILDWVGIDRRGTVGESTLLLAIEWWLTNKEKLAELPRSFPELAEFAQDVSQSDQVVTDAAI